MMGAMARKTENRPNVSAENATQPLERPVVVIREV
jgi:hypothetical protein